MTNGKDIQLKKPSFDDSDNTMIKENRTLKNLAEDLVISYTARIKTIGIIAEDTHRMMDEFKTQRENISKELREILAKCESLRKKDFDRMMSDILTKQSEREVEVKKMLADFRKEEEVMGERLKKLLEKGDRIRIKDFKRMMSDIRQEQDYRTRGIGGGIIIQQIQKDVHAMLNNFKEERQSIANAWNEAISILHIEKTGAKKNFNIIIKKNEKSPKNKSIKIC